MITLYHFALCPFSRLLRFLLSEIQLDFTPININPWKNNEKLLELSPIGQLPIVKYEDSIIVDSASISEFILEKQGKSEYLLGKTPEARQKTRSITNYMNSTVFNNTISPLLNERIAKFFHDNTPPNSNTIRNAKIKSEKHINHLTYLVKSNNYIAGDQFSLADITTSAHISVMDYFGDIKWENYSSLKEWYALMKSRKAFKTILQDILQGFKPPIHYDNLDF